MTYIPGVAVLVFLLVVAGTIAAKLTGDQLLRLMEGRGFLLIATLLLFGLVLSLHLFHEQDWTADVLKVLAGIVVGVAATYEAKGKRSSGSAGVDAKGGRFGDNARVAGRDINETIERMETEVAQIRDSVFNQSTTVNEMASRFNEGDRTFDYLVNPVYEKGERMAEGAASVIGHWNREGWQLVGLTSDYQGMDGVTLLFRKPSVGRQSTVTYHHGSTFKNFLPSGTLRQYSPALSNER